MDVSTIIKSVQQEWTVDEDGNGIQLLGESSNYSCPACGTGWSGWGDAVLQHCRTVHSPEGAATGNGVPNDVTSVGTFHSVELETPGDTTFASETLHEGDWPGQEAPDAN